MRIWLVTVGEPLPIDAGSPRLLRAGILAERLWRAGHEVVWWTSSFDHTAKRHRSVTDDTITLRERYTLKLMHGPGYRRNVSLARMRDHRIVARKFAAQAPAEPRPDVVVASYPTIELAASATRYGRERGVPVVVDVRDLWPDIFLDLVPGWARPLARIALGPLYAEARRALVEATAIVGNARPFVEWGLHLAGRSAGPDDVEFPFGYDTAVPDPVPQAEAAAFWRAEGVSRIVSRPIACFFGTFGRQFDIDTVIAAARLLARDVPPVLFVLCGEGERLLAYREAAADLPNVLFPGWVDAPKIWTLMRMSTVGLAPYRPGAAFAGNLPNKPIEYLSASLPVIAGVEGYLGALLRDWDCGATYAPGDPAALARTLRELVADPARLARMASNAGRLFAERFDADRVYGKMIAYLERLAARRA
ncbi:MAG: glycosyltransferase family 4 protein [Burkholderiales bacterium]|nr:glycosyltransferase family 4 protein [Burkholderiales bacterium]